jgi:DNA-binding response OmpR family regulator
MPPVPDRDSQADPARGGGIDTGIADYIVKPFEAVDLVARVQAGLERRSSPGESVAPRRATPREPSDVRSEEESGPPLILVADDDEDVVELVASQLREGGYEVVTAGDGERALELALERSPNLAIVDVTMPRLSGYEVAARLRESEAAKKVPIIFLTARVQESDSPTARRRAARRT